MDKEKAKDSFWHNPNEEPNCDDYTPIVYEFKDGKKDVLWAKSYVDLTRVVRWAYYGEWERNCNKNSYSVCGCHLKNFSGGCQFPELTCNVCTFGIDFHGHGVPPMSRYYQKRRAMWLQIHQEHGR